MTHLAHAYTAQSPENDPKQAYRVIRPRRRHGQVKITPINRPRMQLVRFNKPTFESRMLGECWCNDRDYG